MIEPILFFSLGFLTAAFLAFLVAPAIWRRAVVLTRKRIEASAPLSAEEIQADKDSIRAEFAMSVRRLEINLKSARAKSAEQVVEINRQRERLKELDEELAARERTIAALEVRTGEMRAELEQREAEQAKRATRLKEAERALEERAEEIEKLGRMFDEASFTASNRQIELAARDAQLEQLSTDIGAARAQRKDAESRMRQAVADAKEARELLKAERKRAADLEKKVERIMATVADREEKLDRREKNLARQGDGAHGDPRIGDLEAELVEARADRVRLEAEISELTLQMSKLAPGAGAEARKAAERLDAERARLEERLSLLLRENRKLKADLQAGAATASGGGDEARHGDALLLEQISSLAAEVVNMAAELDGPDSPIRKALAVAEEGGESARAEPDGKVISLADRVKALQKSATPG